MLEARGLTVWRGDNCLFEGLGFVVAAGTSLVLRGPNGAGKTTLLRVLCGFTRPESGVVLWNGHEREECLRSVASYGGHQPALNLDLSVAKNLEFYARLPGNDPDWESPARLLGLARCRDLEVRHCSAGQRRRAGLVRVLIGRRPAWLLDEPLTNLDREGRDLVLKRLRSHLDDGGLAVLASHEDVDLGDARVATLQLGRS
jgi:heme exporter protein A